jgi:predicted anti-sigma-YlaC factor YlaD
MNSPAPRAMLCERTREWVALRLDGELSDFEVAIMNSHLERCDGCRAFSVDVAAITRELRSAPLEPVRRPVEVDWPRRLRMPLRHLQVAAAAALVVVATGLGSLYGALHGTQRPQISSPLVHAPMGITDDDMLLRKLRVAELRPTGPLPLGATKPPLEISV